MINFCFCLSVCHVDLSICNINQHLQLLLRLMRLLLPLMLLWFLVAVAVASTEKRFSLCRIDTPPPPPIALQSCAQFIITTLHNKFYFGLKWHASNLHYIRFNQFYVQITMFRFHCCSLQLLIIIFDWAGRGEVSGRSQSNLISISSEI